MKALGPMDGVVTSPNPPELARRLSAGEAENGFDSHAGASLVNLCPSWPAASLLPIAPRSELRCCGLLLLLRVCQLKQKAVVCERDEMKAIRQIHYVYDDDDDDDVLMVTMLVMMMMMMMMVITMMIMMVMMKVMMMVMC
jgi:hypothetical protein